jgi:hypothetical protein
MRGENDFIIRNLKSAPGPWHNKPTNSSENSRRDWILDNTGTEIAVLAQTSEGFRPEAYRATLNLITLAPNLLSALVQQTVYLMERGDTPNPHTLELIRDAGGPDLTAPKVPAVQKPKTWDNASQGLIDNVSQTKSNKRQRPLPK